MEMEETFGSHDGKTRQGYHLEPGKHNRINCVQNILIFNPFMHNVQKWSDTL